MKSKLKVYFLLHSNAFLPSWQSFWDACSNDNRILMKIIYCPVRKQGPGLDGQFIKTEEWLNKNGIKYVHIDRINLLSDKPDILFYQTPYDMYHRFKNHRSSYFAKFGINCGYISYGLEFTEHDLSIKNHFKLEIHENSKRIYTFSESIKDDYAKYCPIGNEHVRCVGHPKFDALYNAKDVEMPQWLKEKVNGRKIICWHPHFPCDYSSKNGKTVLSTFSWEENKKILEYIKKDKKHFYIFMPHHLFFGVFERKYEIPQQEIINFKAQLLNSNNSTVWLGEYPEVLQWSDIFMGERSAVTMEMITTQKPVIYLENTEEVYNKFGKDVVSAYYYAKNAKQALKHLDNIKCGIDHKKRKRQKVFNQYFAPYWDGKCGERIKDELLASKNEFKTPLLKNFCSRYLKVNSYTEYNPFSKQSHNVLQIGKLKFKRKINESICTADINYDEKIPVFIIASEDIIEQTIVTMLSIISNTNSFVEFHLIENSRMKISEKNKKYLNKLIREYKNFSFKIHTMYEEDFKEFNLSQTGYVPLDTYFRYNIPLLDKKIKKSIYIDYDLIFTDDISKLYNIELGNNYVGAVNNAEGFYWTPFIKKVVSKLNLKNPEGYFNTGVLLINNEKWLSDDIPHKLYNATLELSNHIDFADQDILNVVFEDSNVKLPVTFNTHPNKVTQEHLPAIIHYVGAQKPWLESNSIATDYYWFYAKKTIYYKSLKSKKCKLYKLTFKNFIKNIFSIENDLKYHKIITILGIRFKIYSCKKHLNYLLNKITSDN